MQTLRGRHSTPQVDTTATARSAHKAQMVVTATSADWGDIGYLVIDSVIEEAAIGGIRYAANVSVEEVSGLAQAMSYKCGFLNIPMGGAKAGIPARADLTPAMRREMLRTFGRSLGPLIRAGIYSPGQDIGFSVDDLNAVHAGAGLQPVDSPYNGAFYTAMTVVESAAAALAQQGHTIAGKRFAIEGLGGVGSYIAQLLNERGGIVVGISTINGALYHQRGLNVSWLLQLRRHYGDTLIAHYTDAEHIPLHELLTVDVDVLIPCARPGTIHSGNVSAVRASTVVPASNNPVTHDAESTLHERGIVLFPDFVANAGSVLAGTLITQGFDDPEVQDIIRDEYAQRVRNLLQRTDMDGQLRTSAQAIANRNIMRMVEESTRTGSPFQRVIERVQEQGISGILERGAALAYRQGWRRSGRIHTLARCRIRRVLLREG